MVMSGLTTSSQLDPLCSGRKKSSITHPRGKPICFGDASICHISCSRIWWTSYIRERSWFPSKKKDVAGRKCIPFLGDEGAAIGMKRFWLCEVSTCVPYTDGASICCHTSAPPQIISVEAAFFSVHSVLLFVGTDCP